MSDKTKVFVDACHKAARQMARDKSASHSFNVINSDSPVKAATLLMLFVPSRLDQEIYDALKPIFDREFGPGHLVEPGKEAQRAIQDA